MSGKKVPIRRKPSTKKETDDAAMNAWVDSRSQEVAKAPMKRLTIDIPAELHSQLKADCALRGSKMTDEIRKLLMEKYGKS